MTDGGSGGALNGNENVMPQKAGAVLRRNGEHGEVVGGLCHAVGPGQNM